MFIYKILQKKFLYIIMRFVRVLPIIDVKVTSRNITAKEYVLWKRNLFTQERQKTFMH